MKAKFYTPTDAFKAVFDASGMSQRKFGRTVGISCSMVSRILASKRFSSWDLLLRLEDEFTCENLVSLSWQ